MTVLHFNPWLFSGAEQLVGRFFGELAAELSVGANKKLVALGAKLERYGDALAPAKFIPGVGIVAEAVTQVAKSGGKAITQQQEKRSSVTALKAELEKALVDINRRFIVVIDDIDRLAPNEVREVFKLVRLTANFPNVVYALAFDRLRTQDVLSEEHFDGAAYIEKILQVSYDVPPPPTASLQGMLLEELDRSLPPLSETSFDEHIWPDVFAECIWPFMRHARDVRRYVASLPVTLRLLGKDVALVDALALEALRIFAPETYALLGETTQVLTRTRDSYSGFSRSNDLVDEVQIQRLIDSGKEKADVVKAFCLRLFPATGRHLGATGYGSDWLDTWKKGRRVAHPMVLQFYLERVPSAEITAAQRATAAFNALADRERFDALVAELSEDELESLLNELLAYADEVPQEALEPALDVLVDTFPRLRTTEKGMYDFGADFSITRLFYRMLRERSEETCEEVVEAVLSKRHSLYGLFSLLTVVGHRENAGHRLVSAAAANGFEERLRAMIENASPQDLVSERKLDVLLWWAGFGDGGPSKPPKSVRDQAVQGALLKASVSAVRSQTMGSRAVRSIPTLQWSLLSEVFGGEDGIREVVKQLDGTNDGSLAESLSLAQKYLSGWRPPGTKNRPDVSHV